MAQIGAGNIAFSGAATFGFATFTDCPPNPRRTIAVLTPGWTDSFPSFSVSETDVVTFDAARLLAPATQDDPAETISTIVSFLLAVDDLRTATDADVSSRTQGIATIEGSTVSQRFGNWQPGVAIRYRATALVTTTAGNELALVGFINVRLPPD